MQRCNCTVRLGGDLNNTVYKPNVTPAEIAVLLAIHGEGSVVDIQPTTQDKTPHLEERSRLSTTYGHHVVDRLFPGEFTKLPVSLSDINLGGDPAEEKTEDPKPGENGDAAVSGQDAVQSQLVTNTNAGAEDEDDKILRERIDDAKTKAELREIAQENDVKLDGVEDRMDALRQAILDGVFPKG